jgi:hypothetical protein
MNIKIKRYKVITEIPHTTYINSLHAELRCYRHTDSAVDNGSTTLNWYNMMVSKKL